MDRFGGLSEERIRKAYEEGEFERLPGLGKPLPKDEFADLPEEIRMAYRLLKNANFSPDEIDVKEEMLRIEDLIRKTEDELEKEELRKELSSKRLQYNGLLSKRGIKTNSSIFKRYGKKIEDKFF